MRWFITGGCGFIGRNLITLIREKSPGDEILIYDNFSVGTPDELKEYLGIAFDEKKIKIIQGDILDKEKVFSVSEGVDAVVHLAANTGVPQSMEAPEFDCRNNVLGTLNMLEAARINRISRFVMASSNAPLGENAGAGVNEDTLPKPLSPYGASKLAGEAYCNVYSKSFDVGTTVLRFSNVYGPGSTHKSSVVAKWIKAAIEGKPVVIYGDGSQTRDFIYVGDIARAVYLSATNTAAAGELFQIATGQETTIALLAETLKDLIKKRGIDIEIEYETPRKGDILKNYSSVSKIKEKLNFSFEYNIISGLEKTLDSFFPENG